VHDVTTVHKFKDTDDLSSVESHQVNRQRPKVLQQLRQRPIRAVLEQEVQVVFILEGAVEFYDIAVLGEFGADVTLTEHGLHLVVFCDVSLLELLQRKFEAVSAGKVYLAVGTAAQSRVKLELFTCVVSDCASCDVRIRR